MKLKKYKKPQPSSQPEYVPPIITMEDSAILQEDIEFGNRVKDERFEIPPPQISPMEETIINTPAANEMLSTNVCTSPECRKRMTVQEAFSSAGNPYKYCRTCRQRVQQKSRNKRYKAKAKQLFKIMNKDDYYVAIDKYFPGFARFKEYEDQYLYQKTQNAAHPTSPSTNFTAGFYIHFLHFRTDLYPIIAEAFSELYFPIDPPNLVQIFELKKILQIITIHKKCRNCHERKSTWYIPERDKDVPITKDPKTLRKIIPLLPPPVNGPSMEDVIFLLEEKLKRPDTYKKRMKTYHFGESYTSKDFWKAGCQACYDGLRKK